MYNPLLSDPSKLKLEDLDNRVNELMRKYFIASKFGQGAVCEQINVILEVYRNEQRKRFVDANQKLIKNQDKNLEDYINVNT
jgi:hypothetical protein